MDRYYYAIIERSYNFCVIATGYGTHEQAWDKANDLYKKYPKQLEYYDVLVFETEEERINYIRENTINGKDYRELYEKQNVNER